MTGFTTAAAAVAPTVAIILIGLESEEEPSLSEEELEGARVALAGLLGLPCLRFWASYGVFIYLFIHSFVCVIFWFVVFFFLHCRVLFSSFFLCRRRHPRLPLLYLLISLLFFCPYPSYPMSPYSSPSLSLYPSSPPFTPPSPSPYLSYSSPHCLSLSFSPSPFLLSLC